MFVSRFEMQLNIYNDKTMIPVEVEPSSIDSVTVLPVRELVWIDGAGVGGVCVRLSVVLPGESGFGLQVPSHKHHNDERTQPSD